MKSFFKKLAFVMAMAMVVSLAAPAAANAAEGDIYLCYQLDETKTAVEMHAMKIGDTQDFRFIGAPKDWKELGWKWETVNPEVATVDVVSGDVTAVAAGTTTLNFILGGEVVATTEIVVSAPSTKDQFTLSQPSYKEIKLTFAEDTEIKSETVKLYLVLPNEEKPEEPIEVPWPVETHKNVDKKTITIQPTVKFGNGDVLKVVAGAHTETITTVIAKPDTIVLTVKDNKLEVNPNTQFQVVPTLYTNANGELIDVTELYSDAYEIKYTPTLTSMIDGKTFTKDDYAWDDDANYVITAEMFEVGMFLSFQAVLYDTKAKVDVATSNTVGVECVEVEPWAFDGKVVDWAIIKTGQGYVDWNQKSLPADASPKGEYCIVLKFKDNAGKTYVTHPDADQDYEDKDAAENIVIDGKTDAISKAKYEVFFYSTNPDVMLIDDATGALGVYTPATVVFYVGLNYFGGQEDVMRYVYAREVVIDEATKLDEIKVKDNKSVNILTAAISDEFKSTETVEILAEDQYNKAWTQVKYTAYYMNKDNKPVAVGTVAGNKITFTSNDFAGLADGTVNVIVEGVTTAPLGNGEKAFTNVRVNIKTPNYTDSTKTEIKLDATETNRYITYNNVLVEDSKIDVNATTKTGYITLYKTSNGAKVGTYAKDDAAGSFVAITSQADIDAINNAGVGAEGTHYVVMRDPSGKIVPLSWTPSGDKLQYTFNNTTKVEGVTGDKWAFAANGGYTVETVIVRFNQRNENPSPITTKATVTVENSFKEVSIKGWLKKTFVGKDCITNGVVDVEKVILQTVEFKDATITAEEIIDCGAVVLGNNVILQYVTVRVYNADKTAYYEKTLKIENVAIKSDGTK